MTLVVVPAAGRVHPIAVHGAPRMTFDLHPYTLYVLLVDMEARSERAGEVRVANRSDSVTV
jgi:hypothetical protein